MHLDWINSFVTVADKRSFVRAAQTLGKAQSRVSEHVAKLESELGIVLIDRSSRPLHLTVAGEVFLGRAKDVLTTLQAARAEMTAIHGSTYGTVRLACMSSVAGLFAPGLIERFTRVEHNIDVHVMEGPTATLPAMLLSRQAELAIVPLEYVANAPELECAHLWKEPFTLVVHPSHRLADNVVADVTELEGESVITPGSGDGARGLSPETARLFRTAGVDVAAARRVASPHTLVSMVRSGLGIGIMSELALQLTGIEGVRGVGIADTTFVRHTVLSWSRQFKLSSSAKRLADFIRSNQPPRGTTRGSSRNSRQYKESMDPS
ncbi:LysR family transcriptional regulator [Rhodococcus sp. NPDC057529]|uniref:LysR family transcriptional regulator n=1 Tax=Rhodococcus sp. NPDC057529 TaxID=3346158 RepID=UPI0036710CF3